MYFASSLFPLLIVIVCLSIHQQQQCVARDANDYLYITFCSWFFFFLCLAYWSVMLILMLQFFYLLRMSARFLLHYKLCANPKY